MMFLLLHVILLYHKGRFCKHSEQYFYVSSEYYFPSPKIILYHLLSICERFCRIQYIYFVKYGIISKIYLCGGFVMDVKVDMRFQCNLCNTIINHNYTQSDVLNNSYLELTCQNCGNTQSVSTSELIEKAKKSAIEELKKHFKIQ